MKEKLLLILLLSFSSFVFAYDSEEAEDVFGGGEETFELVRFGTDEVLLLIDKDAEVACSGGLCKLSSVTTNGKSWEVSISAGMGNNTNSNGGTNIYTGDAGYSLDSDNQNYGITISYKSSSCTQTINVPRSVYWSVNRYLYGLMTDEGGTKKGFTPADEAMIMFYTTIMKQANGCK